MEAKKDISYLGKDFGQFKLNLIDFTKQYFPQSYTDFNESSPGSIFLEMASYVGDVLSYYADTNLKESFLHQATETTNVYDIARTLGYKVKNVIPASVKLDVFQLLPAIGTGTAVRPDFNYALKIKDGMQVKQESGPAMFRTLESIDFSFSSSFNTTDITVYETDNTTKLPTYYLVKKQVNSVSGEVKTATFDFTTAVPYDKIVLADLNVMDIVSIEESDGDNWYEVPYLAQDTIFEAVPNLMENDPDLFQYRSSVSSLLKLRKTSKRFVTRLRADNKIEIQFGAGISDQNDEEIIPNPVNVGNGLAGLTQFGNVSIDPSNFLYTRAYGQAPSNTTLTVTYTVGNGITDNVASNVLTTIQSVKYNENANATSNTSLINFIKTTVSATNSEPARGAKTIDSVSDIKNNAMANFGTQDRLVTAADYIIRSYSLPSKFGSVAKAYIIPDDQLTQQQLMSSRIANPLAMNLYVLGYNDSKQLTELNLAIKENLKTYIDAYRMLTDAINIKNAYIINFGIDFKVTTLPNYNSNDVLLRCISALKTVFDIDKWQINQPIIKSDILNVLANTKGVQSVLSIKLNNLYDSTYGYSGNVYDLGTAERKGIIYPSLDPSIFEIKYPDIDITGQVVSY